MTSSISNTLFQSQGDPVGITIRDLTLDLFGKTLLNHVDLDIEPGKINGLAGESGSGKSLTSMTVLGLPPEGSTITGSILYDGKTELLGMKERERNTYRGRRISMVFQDPTSSMHPMLTIEKQLTDGMRYHLHLNRKQARARAVELLKLVQVPDPEDALDRFPHQFSGGQLQRIAIAMALSCDSRVLIADEPTTALDVTVQAGILHLLKRLNEQLGLTIVLVTHDLGVMSALADTIAVMRKGQIVEVGDRYDIINHPKHPYTIDLINSLPTKIEERMKNEGESR
ncbi:ABC transporter [Bifidobacterium adolescentis]|uniref:ABC transporter ATP-binding protein n=1 Tax=Bifidobacterium adolescentis TaxID=1680 RepID=UPI000690985C|nr:ABC transporter ATP-binding protein [Bifidobacterium adolescentis]MEE0905965.1 ABC transporter ATP-binding protein [Bifidobacterium adolescentis]OSH00275.1 ABC transporter [Bifidobacterium adolescentis]